MIFKQIFKYIFFLFGLLLTGVFLFQAEALAATDPLVIVIDPGHGGENLGAQFNGYTEKELTMTTALAMKEELEKFQGVEVYLTHTEDVDMSLKERAEFAAYLEADFLFSLHYNASLSRNIYGTEVWISAFDEYYANGMSFGQIQIETMESMGLFSRGVKTRLKDDRSEDYYGIIRESRTLGINCALIEHCHLDHPNDQIFYDSEEKLKAFGKANAESVAKYFGLTSDILQVDYSDYKREEIAIPGYVMAPDYTDPDVCYIEKSNMNPDTGEVEIRLTAQDYDSYLIYYSYSYDGGVSWSDLYPWEKGRDTLDITLLIPSGTKPDILFRAHNLYDRFTDSNMISLEPFHYVSNTLVMEESESPVEITEEETTDILAASTDTAQITFEVPKEEKEKEFSFLLFLEICLFAAIIIFFAAIVTRAIQASKRKRRRRK